MDFGLVGNPLFDVRHISWRVKHKGNKVDKKRIAVASLIVLTNTIGATAILPMLPVYVEKQFQATPVQATFAIAAFYAAQFFAAPWLGKLSDQVGRRPILIISQIGTIGSYFIVIFAAQLGAAAASAGIAIGISGGLAAICVARLVDGFTGGNVTVAEAYASDISDDKSRTQALGLIGGAVGLGHILGPVLTVALSGISLIAPIVGATVMSVITLILTIALLNETVHRKSAPGGAGVSVPSTAALLSQRSVALTLAAAIAIALYLAAAVSSLSLYVEHVLLVGQPAGMVVQTAGMMVVALGLVAAVVQSLVTGPLAQRLGEKTLVVLGSGLLAASAIGVASTNSVVGATVAIIIYAFGYALSWPSLQTVMIRFGSKNASGKLLGLLQSTFSFALIVSPMVAGSLLEANQPRLIYTIGAALSGVAFVLGVIIMHLPFGAGASAPVEAPDVSEPKGFFQRLHH